VFIDIYLLIVQVYFYTHLYVSLVISTSRKILYWNIDYIQLVVWNNQYVTSGTLQ